MIAFCPVCVHVETMASRFERSSPSLEGIEPTLEFGPPPLSVAHPKWAPPLAHSKWAKGVWVCNICNVRLTPLEAGVMLDSALMHVVPDCDSITTGPEPMHLDAENVLKSRWGPV